MSKIEFAEVSRSYSTVREPARFGCPSHTRHLATVVKRGTWAQDGSLYAGIVYERTEHWNASESGYLHQLIGSGESPVRDANGEILRMAV